MQDVKLGRGKNCQTIADDFTGSGGGEFAGKNNPDRAAYFITAQFEAAALIIDQVKVYSANNVGPVVAVLTPNAPTAMIDVERFGDAAIAPLLLVAASSVNVSISVAEIVWTQPLETVLSNAR